MICIIVIAEDYRQFQHWARVTFPFWDSPAYPKCFLTITRAQDIPKMWSIERNMPYVWLGCPHDVKQDEMRDEIKRRAFKQIKIVEEKR
jgi:hypothetical protein